LILAITAACILATSCGSREPSASTSLARTKNAAKAPSGVTAKGWALIGSCSPLGAIYHSAPVVVPPPQTFDSDDENFGRDRTGSTSSFYDRLIVWQDSLRPQIVEAESSEDGEKWIPAPTRWVKLDEGSAMVRLPRKQARVRLVVTAPCDVKK